LDECINSGNYDEYILKDIETTLNAGVSAYNIKKYIDQGKFDLDQLEQILKGLAKGYDDYEMLMLADPKKDAKKMEAVNYGILMGCSLDCIDYMIKNYDIGTAMDLFEQSFMQNQK